MGEVAMRVSKGAKQGSTLKMLPNMGHQTPGKFPGKVHFKVQRGASPRPLKGLWLVAGSKEDSYRIAEADLHTVGAAQ